MATTSKTPAHGHAKGITKLSKEKHGFNGYLVRMQRNKFRFSKFVAAGPISRKGLAPSKWDAAAQSEAAAAVACLRGIVDDPKSWRKRDGQKSLIRKSALEVEAQGFKIIKPL